MPFNESDFKEKRQEIFNELKKLEINLDGHIPVLGNYDQVNQKRPKLHLKDNLKNWTSQLISAQTTLLSGFYTLFVKSLGSKISDAVVTNYTTLAQLAPSIPFTFPPELINATIRSSLFQFSSTEKKLVIFDNPTKKISELFENQYEKNLIMLMLIIPSPPLKSISDLIEKNSSKEKIKSFLDVLEYNNSSYYANYTSNLVLDIPINKKTLDKIFIEISKWSSAVKPKSSKSEEDD